MWAADYGPPGELGLRKGAAEAVVVQPNLLIVATVIVFVTMLKSYTDFAPCPR
jgi:hypothetical protein